MSVYVCASAASFVLQQSEGTAPKSIKPHKSNVNFQKKISIISIAVYKGIIAGLRDKNSTDTQKHIMAAVISHLPNMVKDVYRAYLFLVFHFMAANVIITSTAKEIITPLTANGIAVGMIPRLKSTP